MSREAASGPMLVRGAGGAAVDAQPIGTAGNLTADGRSAWDADHRSSPGGMTTCARAAHRIRTSAARRTGMLSDYEQRELATITEGLADDRRLVEVLGGDRPAPTRNRRMRALVGLGILLLVVGVVCGDGRLFLEGLLIAGAGMAWSRWRRWLAAKAAGRSAATPNPGLTGPPAA
jgi:Protein of unknown function (DUF3040)